MPKVSATQSGTFSRKKVGTRPVWNHPPPGICVKRVPLVKLAFAQQNGAFFFCPERVICSDFALQKQRCRKIQSLGDVHQECSAELPENDPSWTKQNAPFPRKYTILTNEMVPISRAHPHPPGLASLKQRVLRQHLPLLRQWNPKYGCRGTVTARFALIAFVAWKRLADSTLGKLLVHPEYG